MTKIILTILAFTALTVFTSCNRCMSFEVDTQQLQEKIYVPDETTFDILNPSVILYLDHSTCVIDARQNSQVFNALRPQLGQYSDTLVMIKGIDFEKIAMNRSQNDVFAALQTIRHDIPFAHIQKALEQIVDGNQQAILITDCEYIEKVGNGILCHDRNPYLSVPFKRWLKKGHAVYIVVEPYQERYQGRMYDKKRFYFLFTDDRIQAPISQMMLNEIQPHLQSGLCMLFKMTNSDVFVQRNGEIVENDLTFTHQSLRGFDYIAIYDDWKSIRQFVMKLNKYEIPIPDEEPVPLIKNLFFNDGNNYLIKDMEIKATNITLQYLALEDSTVVSKVTDMSDGFRLDRDALKNNELKVFLTNRIFTHIADNQYCEILIRLDFAITDVEIKPFDADMFTWKSMFVNDEAICVSKSIENALQDFDVVPHKAVDRRIIHTVFIKTNTYK